MKTLAPRDVDRILAAVRGLLEVPVHRFWVDYDEEADVLYLSFRRPQRAAESELRDDGVIVRTRGGRVVGLTILGASRRAGRVGRAGRLTGARAPR